MVSDPCPACGRSMLRFEWDEVETDPVVYCFRMICNGCGFREEHRHGGGLVMTQEEKK